MKLAASRGRNGGRIGSFRRVYKNIGNDEVSQVTTLACTKSNPV